MFTDEELLFSFLYKVAENLLRSRSGASESKRPKPHSERERQHISSVDLINRIAAKKERARDELLRRRITDQFVMYHKNHHLFCLATTSTATNLRVV
jgi:hypothetical protein